MSIVKSSAEPTYNATLIGTIFTVVNLALTITFIVPIISIMPGGFIEHLVASFVNNEPYSNVGAVTLMVLVIVQLISLIFVFYLVRNKNLHKGHITGLMLMQFFIFHSLGFYLYWATVLNFRSDGQLAFGVFSSFPASSFGFVILGFIVDIIKRR